MLIDASNARPLPLGTTVFIVDRVDGGVSVETVATRTISIYNDNHAYTTTCGLILDGFNPAYTDFTDADIYPAGNRVFTEYKLAEKAGAKIRKEAGRDE